MSVSIQTLSEVRASQDIPQGQLVLAPVTHIDRVVAGSPQSVHVVSGTTGTWSLETPAKMKAAKAEEWSKGSVASAFWWVAHSEDADDCNITVKAMAATDGKYKFPVYEDTKFIRNGDLLVCHVAKREGKKQRK